jgi:hypothetical protein
MPAIVDFPTVVQEALTIFGDLFDTEPARRHFAEYLGSGPILVMSGEAWYIPHLYPEETRTAIP